MTVIILLRVFHGLVQQDLFDDEHDRNGDHDRQGEPSNDFHFSLDEDTQFTQILNTQG